MLIGIPTKYGTCIELQGDFYELNSLWNTIHYISSNLDDIPESTLIVSLASDVRKAKDNQREEVTKENKNTYYSVKIFWYIFIVIINLLRIRLEQLPKQHVHLANIYRLEALFIEALMGYNLSIGMNISKWITLYKVCIDEKLLVLDSFVSYNLLSTKNGIHRFRALEKELMYFLDSSQEREQLLIQLKEVAKQKNCEIEDLSMSSTINSNGKLFYLRS